MKISIPADFGRSTRKATSGRFTFLLLTVLSCILCAHSPSSGASELLAVPFNRGDTNDWLYLDNGQIRLGVKKTSGCAIGYFSAATSATNLLNNFDRGRFVQQSYYGDPDGSFWAGKPWRWNPVQGGGWQGGGAKLLELTHDHGRLYAKTLGVHWASGKSLPEVIMEEWITLNGRIAKVRFRMSYAGTNTFRPANQEIPAFFADASLHTLILYDGQKPWTGDPVCRVQPGWPNENRQMTENWAAYVDDQDFGVGAYVPAARLLTCYRYKGEGAIGCSYFAPLANFAIRPAFIFQYEVYLTIGKTREIRDAFYRIHNEAWNSKTRVRADSNQTDGSKMGLTR